MGFIEASTVKPYLIKIKKKSAWQGLNSSNVQRNKNSSLSSLDLSGWLKKIDTMLCF
jgi:hypothetical protein